MKADQMTRKASSNPNPPIGEILRTRRVEVLHRGLREMAALLSVAPAHLTDIEKGRRTPSEELLLRIQKNYGIEEATLRAGWNRPQAIVDEVASQSPTTAEKVPEFLRTARDLSSEQWDSLIKQAKKLSSSGRGKES
jgi:plasmid maintenance system antidote protein VapI